MIKNRKFIWIILGAFFTGLVLQQYDLFRLESDLEPFKIGSTKGLVGELRPKFSLYDFAGESRQISEWDGDVIVLNFWASWCPSCLTEIPMLTELSAQYEDQEVTFIGLALQEKEEIVSYMEEVKIGYTVLVGTLDVMQIAISYGNSVGALPYTVVVDRHQKIASQHYGVVSKSDIEQVILPLL